MAYGLSALIRHGVSAGGWVGESWGAGLFNSFFLFFFSVFFPSWKTNAKTVVLRNLNLRPMGH